METILCDHCKQVTQVEEIDKDILQLCYNCEFSMIKASLEYLVFDGVYSEPQLDDLVDKIVRGVVSYPVDKEKD